MLPDALPNEFDVAKFTDTTDADGALNVTTRSVQPIPSPTTASAIDTRGSDARSPSEAPMRTGVTAVATLALVAALSLSDNVSAPSAAVSSLITTGTVFTVSPGAKL